MPEHIKELIQLAEIYFEDGAPNTAADRLRQAADEMELIAERRNEMIKELMFK